MRVTRKNPVSHDPSDTGGENINNHIPREDCDEKLFLIIKEVGNGFILPGGFRMAQGVSFQAVQGKDSRFRTGEVEREKQKDCQKYIID